jgi:hypothetical protein
VVEPQPQAPPEPVSLSAVEVAGLAVLEPLTVPEAVVLAESLAPLEAVTVPLAGPESLVGLLPSSSEPLLAQAGARHSSAASGTRIETKRMITTST